MFIVGGPEIWKRAGAEAVAGPVCGIFPGFYGSGSGPLANLVWLFAGASLQKLFSDHRKVVDLVLAASLALCAVTLVWPH